MAGHKKFYVGNLSLTVTKEDLAHHFGLDMTPYLRSSCWIELAVQRSGQSQGFGFVNVPEHLAGHLLQLNGTKLYDKHIKVEPAKNQKAIPSLFMSAPHYGGGAGPMFFQQQRMRGRRMEPINNEMVTVPPENLLQLTDVGVNLPHKAFKKDIAAVIEQAEKAGVQKMILTGNTLGFSHAAVTTAKTKPGVLYAAIGIHPHFAEKEWKDETYKELEELAKEPEVVAIGEVGLDFHRNYSKQESQITAFEKQIELACQVQKPLLAHERSTHQKFIEVLSQYSGRLPPIVVHCFTGSASEMSAYVAMGFYIGITGFICKDPAGKPLREALKEGGLPLDRILLESDAPYMIPNAPNLDTVSKSLLDRCRPGRNEPCTLSLVAHTVAKCLGVDAEEVAKASTENAMRVFDIKPTVPDAPEE